MYASCNSGLDKFPALMCFCGYSRRRAAGVDALLHAPQRTALGIVLDGTRVDVTVPGSPAQVCGMIDTSDELLMVDGQKVSAQTAMAALRGSDVPASVVSLVLRKSGMGEVVKVQLPRTSLDIVKRRQELNEGLEQLQENILQAFARGDKSQASEALAKIAKDARTLDRMNFDLHLHLSNQVSCLLEAVETLVSRSKVSVLAVDATHQQVHVLQSLTESELRQHLLHDPATSGNMDRETMLQKQVQELEGDLKALQEELSSAQILRRECLEDVHQLQQRVSELEDEIRERQGSQDRLKGALSRVEDGMVEAQGEISQQPYALRVVLGVDYEDTVANAETKAVMDLQLQEDISIALRIAKSQVEVLCYSRGLGTMAELRISPTMSAPSHTSRSETAASGRALAEELQRQIADPKSEIHQGAAGKHIKEVDVHGPIAIQAARALRSALLEMEGDLARTRLDLVRVQDKMAEASERHRAVIKEEELMKQEIMMDCDTRLKAASADFREQLARVVEMEREQIQKEQALAFEAQKAEHNHALELQILDSRKHIASLEAEKGELELELKSVRDHQYDVEMQKSSAKLELVRTKEKLRHAERTSSEIQQACQKVDEILVPELTSCLMTLGNIENEMGFFHSHVTRAAALASSTNGASSLLSQDAHRSKEVCVPP
jgi:chromosome segregation ATPase